MEPHMYGHGNPSSALNLHRNPLIFSAANAEMNVSAGNGNVQHLHMALLHI